MRILLYGSKMPEAIRISCEPCGASYSVSAEYAGHKVRCTKCGHSFELPADFGGGGEGRTWFFRMPGGQKFGPLSKPELDGYLHEGIITADCHVLHDGDNSWQRAGEVYPDVPEFQSQASRSAGETEPMRGGIACSGLLERIPDIRAKLPSEHKRSHDLFDAQLREEAASTKPQVRVIGSRSLGLVQSVAFGKQFTENFAAQLPQRRNVYTNSLVIAGCECGVDEFYVVAPHSNLERMPCEFFAVIEGCFPTSVALVAGSSGPEWTGSVRGVSSPGGAAMKNLSSKLGEEAQWKWSSKDRKSKQTLDWAIQIVPLGSSQYVLIAQTAGLGRRGKLVGLEWFARQLRLAKRLRFELSVPGKGEAHFPLHSETAELLARMFYDA